MLLAPTSQLPLDRPIVRYQPPEGLSKREEKLWWYLEEARMSAADAARFSNLRGGAYKPGSSQWRGHIAYAPAMAERAKTLSDLVYLESYRSERGPIARIYDHVNLVGDELAGGQMDVQTAIEQGRSGADELDSGREQFNRAHDLLLESLKAFGPLVPIGSAPPQ
jgi:hypothetical protein